MPRPLSLDLRQRIIGAWQRGEGTWDEIANRFDVGSASVNRLVRRFRQFNSIEPKPATSGAEHKIADDQLPKLREIVEAEPDLTLPELVQTFGSKTGNWVSEATIGRAVRDRLGLTRKKRPLSRRSAPIRR